MKSQLVEKNDTIKEDDTLFGLLSIYKIFNTYFRILFNENSKNLILEITGNPKKWPKMTEDKYQGYRLLKRSELGLIKLSVKYISPEHLINQLGSLLGLKIPENEVIISNNLLINGFYSIELKSKYLKDIISVIDKIIDLTPAKKYELLEKCLSEDI
ncbi:MAG: hypothetical protein V1874_15970 [Spirochaetota bacterium]